MAIPVLQGIRRHWDFLSSSSESIQSVSNLHILSQKRRVPDLLRHLCFAHGISQHFRCLKLLQI